MISINNFYLLGLNTKPGKNCIQIFLFDVVISYVFNYSITKPFKKSKEIDLLKSATFGISMDLNQLSTVLHRIYAITQQAHSTYSTENALFLSSDIEYAYILLRAIYDSIAIIIKNTTNSKNKTPDSYHDLIKAVKKENCPLESEIKKTILESEPHFKKVRDSRNHIIHYNKDPMVILKDGRYNFTFDIKKRAFDDIINSLATHLKDAINIMNKLGRPIYLLLNNKNSFKLSASRIAGPFMEELSTFIKYKSYNLNNGILEEGKRI